MDRHLIVANQTLGGADLEEVIKDRIEHGESRFYVVVPMIEPEHEVVNWAPQDPMFGAPVPVQVDEDALEEARTRSRHRLDLMLEKVTSLGGEVDGEVGATDPARAVEAVLERESFDEVIVSTLPAGISRWVKMDLPSRIGRMTQCPVTTVEAQA